MLDLTEIKARVEAATPGPWHHGEHHDASCGRNCTVDGCHEGHPSGLFFVDGPESDSYDGRDYAREEDAIFIAHSRQDIPDLVAEVEHLREAVEHRQDAIKKAISVLERQTRFADISLHPVSCDCWNCEAITAKAGLQVALPRLALANAAAIAQEG